MKKILALVFSLIILEQNSNARYEFNEENEDFDSWSSTRDSWNDDEDDYNSSYRKTSSWDDDEDDYNSSYRKTSSWDDEDDYNSSYRKTSSWDDEDNYDSSYRKTSSWNDDEDDYNSSYRKTSSWDDDEDDYNSSYRKTSSWDDEDDYDSSYRKTSSWDDDDDYDSSYRKTSSWDDDDWGNPRSKKKQREQEKSLIKRRNQEAINRIILDETPENEKIDLLTDQLKLANTRMKKYISKLKRKSADPNLDFIEQSFKFNNDGIGILLENSRADAEWKGKIFKENPESEYNNNEEETEEQTTTDGSLVIYDQVTDKYIREINKMTREECQKKVRNGIIDKEYFFQLSLDNSQKINKAVTSIIEAVENRNGKTSQINKRRDMENALKLRLLVALNSNLFKDVEFVRSIKNQIKVLGESIRESYETASENVKKNHPYLKFLIVDKI